MKKVFQIAIAIMLLLCVPMNNLYADNSSDDDEVTNKSVSYNVSVTDWVPFGSTTVYVYYNGYVTVNSSGNIESWNIIATCSAGTITNQSYKMNNGHLIGDATVSYGGQSGYSIAVLY